MGNPLCHFEIAARDVAATKKFYSSVFDWKSDSSSMPEYTLINTGKEPGGGLMQVAPQMPGPCLSMYFQVDNIAATLKKVTAAGGQVCVPETPIPNVGAFAIIADPDGLPFGVFRPQMG